jgi:hypothetical protein
MTNGKPKTKDQERAESTDEKKRKKALRKMREKDEEESFLSEMLEEVDDETYDLLKKLK